MLNAAYLVVPQPASCPTQQDDDNDQLQSTIAYLRTELSDTRRLRSKLFRRVTQLDATNDELQSTVAALETELNEDRLHKLNLIRRVNELDAENDKLQSTVAALQAGLEDADVQKSQLSSRVAHLDDENGRLQSCQRLNSELNSRVTQLDAENGKLQSTNASLESELKDTKLRLSRIIPAVHFHEGQKRSIADVFDSPTDPKFGPFVEVVIQDTFTVHPRQVCLANLENV